MLGSALLLLCQFAHGGSFHNFASAGWSQTLEALGIEDGTPETARVIALGPGAAASPAWVQRVEKGTILLLEGESPVAESFGFRGGRERIRVVSIVDARRPKLPLVWSQPELLPRFTVPENAKVFARERWTNAPVLAGVQRGAGAVLWVISGPGPQGYEKFPYVPHALADLGLRTPFRSARLWAFFDSSYRMRVDLDYFAARWRSSGIAALHVAAWHFWEEDRERDQYLARLIDACHRNGILVYAWLEFPHVSEAFWDRNPDWREKTAVLQDAHLDWRKLMNLANRDCFRAVSAGLDALVGRFDWDGVNLAELYFESLEGAANPSRFTPMNADVRRLFQAQAGFDPIRRFGERQFLQFRAELARKMQGEWLGEIRRHQRVKPHLDGVLTHVDDRFDPTMRDAIGADAAAVLSLVDQQNLTFLVEDPATVWNLGPQRYPEIARRYHPLTKQADKLAIDINIVERYQDVYPTRQQTGAELFQLVHVAARAFPRVALYFENSLLPPDLALLPAAAAVARGGGGSVDSPHGVGVVWKGPALVDGKLWPVLSESTVWLPPGRHTIEPARSYPPLRVLDFNGELRDATVRPDGAIEIRYRSASRSIAILERRPVWVETDGPVQLLDSGALLLPPGEHTVTMR